VQGSPSPYQKKLQFNDTLDATLDSPALRKNLRSEKSVEGNAFGTNMMLNSVELRDGSLQRLPSNDREANEPILEQSNSKTLLMNSDDAPWASAF
jgi:hypothetical protein